MTAARTREAALEAACRRFVAQVETMRYRLPSGDVLPDVTEARAALALPAAEPVHLSEPPLTEYECGCLLRSLGFDPQEVGTILGQAARDAIERRFGLIPSTDQDAELCGECGDVLGTNDELETGRCADCPEGE